MQWHPSGTVFIVAGRAAEIVIVDLALNPLKVSRVSGRNPVADTFQLSAFFP